MGSDLRQHGAVARDPGAVEALVVDEVQEQVLGVVGEAVAVPAEHQAPIVPPGEAAQPVDGDQDERSERLADLGQRDRRAGG